MQIREFRIPAGSIAGIQPTEKPWKSTEDAQGAYAGCAPDLQPEFLKGLTPGQRAVIAIGVVRGEVDNGGFAQFFSNSSCGIVTDGIEGLRLVGAARHAEVVEEALKASELQPEELLDDERRMAKLRTIDSEKAFASLDTRFYELNSDEATGLDSLIQKYYETHESEFHIGEADYTRALGQEIAKRRNTDYRIEKPKSAGEPEDDSTLSFSTNVLKAIESAPAIQVTVLRSGGTNSTFTVDFYTANGTATAGADYLSTNGTLSFGPGVAKKIFNVPLLNDSLVEGDETFQVIITNFSGALPGSITNLTATILDNDSVIGFETNSVKVSENVKTTGLRVIRTGGVAGAASVRYLSTPGAAVSRGDFGKISGTLSFKAGETNKLIYVNIVNDKLTETNENFFVTLSAPTGESALGVNQIAVTILDDEVSAGADAPEVAPDPVASIMRSPGGSLFLAVAAPIGAAVRIEKSSDLVGWDVFEETLVDRLNFQIALPLEGERTFYRALSPQPPDPVVE